MSSLKCLLQRALLERLFLLRPKSLHLCKNVLKECHKWEASLQCYTPQTLLCISNVCFAFLLLLTAFHFGVLHDGFCILKVAALRKW